MVKRVKKNPGDLKKSAPTDECLTLNLIWVSIVQKRISVHFVQKFEIQQMRKIFLNTKITCYERNNADQRSKKTKPRQKMIQRTQVSLLTCRKSWQHQAPPSLYFITKENCHVTISQSMTRRPTKESVTCGLKIRVNEGHVK